MYLQVLECEKNQTLVQTAWNYMNDSLRTNVFVRFQAETIACACIYLAARALQMPLPSRPHWYLLFGATEEEIKNICIKTLKLYTRKKPDYDRLEKEVEKRKMSMQEAKLKAKGLNPDGTPALSNLGGFSPGSKPCSPSVVKVENTSPDLLALKPVKKEPDGRAQGSKSPHNGLRKEVKIARNSGSGSRSRTRSRSRSPRRHYNSRRSRSGTYSSRSRSRSHSRSPSPRRHPPSPLLPHLKSKPGHHGNIDPKPSSRHSSSGGGAHKRKRSRSRSASKGERERERGRELDRDRSTSDLSSAKKHKHERGGPGGGHHRGDRRERSRSYERERTHKGKRRSSSGGHSGHGRHRR
ncbi:cyclin-L1-like isoform X4 [Salvelinus fontinalis]|nr:cyclin-L1-like isoform X4 [Salvelinus fontinalis]